MGPTCALDAVAQRGRIFFRHRVAFDLDLEKKKNIQLRYRFEIFIFGPKSNLKKISGFNGGS